MSSSDFPSPAPLAHSFNSRGELGMFVNPSTCPCTTCRSVVAEREGRVQPSPVVVQEEQAPGPGIGLLSQADTLPPPPPLVRVNAFADALGRTPSATTSEEADLMDRLSSLRSQLQLRQDEVYSQDARSHDEMAMHDTEWEELDRKIDAIEQVLSAFGVLYRTR
jgi:hypothetical protein